MYLISSKYYLKRRVTNKVAKSLLQLNATLICCWYVVIVTTTTYCVPNSPYLWYVV